MELVDLPGRSPIGRICSLGTYHLRKAKEGFRDSFCASKLGVPEISFGGLFCRRGDPLKGKNDLLPFVPWSVFFLLGAKLMSTYNTISRTPASAFVFKKCV